MGNDWCITQNIFVKVHDEHNEELERLKKERDKIQKKINDLKEMKKKIEIEIDIEHDVLHSLDKMERRADEFHENE